MMRNVSGRHAWRLMAFLRRGKREREGLASSIAITFTILILLLALTIFTSVWVPNIAKEYESNHFLTVQNDFGMLKATIDNHIGKPESNLTIFSPITMGSKGVPIFAPAPSSDISLYPSEKLCNLTIGDSGYGLASVSFGGGGIKYYINNQYYAPGSVIYENGAVIVSQGSASYMIYAPKFVVENLTGEGSTLYNFSLELSFITVYGETITKSSSEKNVIGVITKVISSKENVYALPRVTSTGEDNYVNFTIVTRYTDAWLGFFDSALSEISLPHEEYSVYVVQGESISFALNHTVRLAFRQSIISTVIE